MLLLTKQWAYMKLVNKQALCNQCFTTIHSDIIDFHYLTLEGCFQLYDRYVLSNNQRLFGQYSIIDTRSQSAILIV